MTYMMEKTILNIESFLNVDEVSKLRQKQERKELAVPPSEEEV